MSYTIRSILGEKELSGICGSWWEVFIVACASKKWKVSPYGITAVHKNYPLEYSGIKLHVAQTRNVIWRLYCNWVKMMQKFYPFSDLVCAGELRDHGVTVHACTCALYACTCTCIMCTVWMCMCVWWGWVVCGGSLLITSLTLSPPPTPSLTAHTHTKTEKPVLITQNSGLLLHFTVLFCVHVHTHDIVCSYPYEWYRGKIYQMKLVSLSTSLYVNCCHACGLQKCMYM